MTYLSRALDSLHDSLYDDDKDNDAIGNNNNNDAKKDNTDSQRSAGLVAQSNPQIFLKKMRKLNTDLFYRQKKVNLLQEESQGYAKLLLFLHQLPCRSVRIG